ncbi:hypothetical protein ILYODFUR_038137 [Ilyodon furcidens]|uniref:Uncharacterized protein n=1 Tax=Ilyodon furcidens TaxID=33524 RepID=A0ABV0TQ92_9TELE
MYPGVSDLESLGPWLDLLRRRRLLAGPVGSSSALWLLDGSPGALLCSSLGRLRWSRQWSSWGSHLLGGLLMSVAQISAMSVSGLGGQICGSSHSLLHTFMEKAYIYTSTLTHTPMGVLDLGVNRYTDVLY